MQRFRVPLHEQQSSPDRRVSSGIVLERKRASEELPMVEEGPGLGKTGLFHFYTLTSLLPASLGAGRTNIWRPIHLALFSIPTSSPNGLSSAFRRNLLMKNLL